MSEIIFTGYKEQEITIHEMFFDEFLQEHKTITLTRCDEFPDVIAKINDNLYLLRIFTYNFEFPDFDYIDELWVVAPKEEVQQLYNRYEQLSFDGLMDGFKNVYERRRYDGSSANFE